MEIFALQKVNLRNKTVLVRVDFNVPLKAGKVVDNSKIVASLPTVKFLLQHDCKIIIITHLGRPNGRIVQDLRSNPVAKELQKLLKQKVTKFDTCIGKETQEKIMRSRSSVFMLENLRFYRQEEQNNPAFAHSLADLADIYVNDAFGVSHRKHASVEAITHFLPSFPGFLLEKEIRYLSEALSPKKPAVWILGGAKLDKIDLVNQALKKSDYILIGGALGFPFLRAKGIKTGMSKCDGTSVRVAAKLLGKWSSSKIILPKDFVVAEEFSPTATTKVVKYNQIAPHHIGLDLGPETVQLYKRYLRKAHTIVWNGPLGYFEWSKFATSTREIGRFFRHSTATSIVGGGETAEAIKKFHLGHHFSHISTGGGASLAFLSGKKLPGLVALEQNLKKFAGKIKP
jgi:phosphoglycerate kinase